MEGYEEWKELLLSKKEYQFDPTDGDPHLTGEFRDKCLMHKDEDLMSFFAEVTNCVQGCLQAAGIKNNMVTPYFMKSWFTIKKESDELSEHTHACSDLSFVYYLRDTVLHFKQEKNLNAYFGGVYDPKTEDRSFVTESNFINSSYASVPVEEGDLLVFPSNIPHLAGADPTVEDDVYVRSVAGDIKLVLNEEYTQLETGMIHFKHWRSFT